MQLTSTCGLIIAALAAMTSLASGDPIEVGGYAGMTVTNTRTTYDCPDDLRPSERCIVASNPGHGGRGAALGAYVRYPSMRHIRLETGLVYVRKGYDSGPEVGFHYIEVPLFVRFSTVDDAVGMRVFVHSGLAPAVLVWCHDSGVAFDNDRNETFSYSGSCADGPYRDRTPSRFDLGGVFGAGFGFKRDHGILEFEARYARSFFDIAPNEGGKTVNHAFIFLASFGRAIRQP
jgi:hypothetical protein